MLTLESLRTISGETTNGFTIRNAAGLAIAIGAKSAAHSFLVISHKRYENDSDLVAKCERLAGLKARI
jgi:hypothetical protein